MKEPVPLLSIVVATKNARDWLVPLLAEFAGRHMADVEMVVVDGASTDGTPEVLESAAAGLSEHALRWISRPDSGINEAWDRGVALARGEWVLFMGADDRLGLPQEWEKVRCELAAAELRTGVVAGAVEMTSTAGASLGVVRPVMDDRFLALNTLPHQGVFHRRSLWAEHGGFDPHFPGCGDYEFLLRLHVRGVQFRLVPEMTTVRMTFGGVSKHDPLRNLREYARAQTIHGVRSFRIVWWAAWSRAQVRRCGRAILGAKRTDRWADRIRRWRGLEPVWTVK